MSRVVFVVETKLSYGATSRTTWPTLTWARLAAAKLEAQGFAVTVEAFAVDL